MMTCYDAETGESIKMRIHTQDVYVNGDDGHPVLADVVVTGSDLVLYDRYGHKFVSESLAMDFIFNHMTPLATNNSPAGWAAVKLPPPNRRWGEWDLWGTLALSMWMTRNQVASGE